MGVSESLQSDDRSTTENQLCNQRNLNWPIVLYWLAALTQLSLKSFNMLFSKVWIAPVSPKAHWKEEWITSDEDSPWMLRAGPSWSLLGKCFDGLGEVALLFWEARNGKPQETAALWGGMCRKPMTADAKLDGELWRWPARSWHCWDDLYTCSSPIWIFHFFLKNVYWSMIGIKRLSINLYDLIDLEITVVLISFLSPR